MSTVLTPHRIGRRQWNWIVALAADVVDHWALGELRGRGCAGGGGLPGVGGGLGREAGIGCGEGVGLRGGHLGLFSGYLFGFVM